MLLTAEVYLNYRAFDLIANDVCWGGSKQPKCDLSESEKQCNLDRVYLTIQKINRR